MNALVGVAERVEPAPDVRVVEKDPKDDKCVAVALGGSAEYVVTLDRRHMFALGAHETVRLATPGDFLAVLRSSKSWRVGARVARNANTVPRRAPRHDQPRHHGPP